MRAWAESTQPDSGEQAQRVLNQMQKWYEEGKISVRPNVVCYTTVMNAWGRGNAPSKVALKNVEGLLRKMENLYEETLVSCCPVFSSGLFRVFSDLLILSYYRTQIYVLIKSVMSQL